jgi:hypothetical protein
VPQHDGSLSTLAVTCGLVDILGIQHSMHPFPPTYVHGKTHLDYILVSSSISHSIQCSGILPYNSIFKGKHQPCFIDIDSIQLFGSHSHPLTPPEHRLLQLSDPCCIDIYKEHLHKQLVYHNIIPKIRDLSSITKGQQWPSDHQHAYKKIDKIVIERMLYAEDNLPY